MDPIEQDRAIASIYDGAIDRRRWRDALRTIAGAAQCAQASLDIYSPSGEILNGLNPFLDLDLANKFFSYWRPRFLFWRRRASMPVGRTVRSEDLFDEAFWKGEFYNEWSTPQGIGRHGRYVNVAASCHADTYLRTVRPLGAPDFDPGEERFLEAVSGHFIRALVIHRRLHAGQAQLSLPSAAGAPAGFLLVDRKGRILAAHAPTHSRLQAAGLISSTGEQGSVGGDNPALERLIHGAAYGRPGAGPRAGEVERRGRDGVLLKILVVPVTEGVAVTKGDYRAPAWLAIDQPAALLFVLAPEDALRERVARLAAEHCLTPAEAAVAIEAASGKGRAAVAARLGIRETTVRSHLSAIFDKLDIHRQAELSRMVAGD